MDDVALGIGRYIVWWGVALGGVMAITVVVNIYRAIRLKLKRR